MTMDVATCLDPEIAVALAASPMGSIDFGTFTFDSLPVMVTFCGLNLSTAPETRLAIERCVSSESCLERSRRITDALASRSRSRKTESVGMTRWTRALSTSRSV